MSLPRQLPSAQPDPDLAARFESPPGGVPREVRRQAEFFVFFARTIFPLLETFRERLERLYCPDNGRPAWDPVRLLGVLILQFVLRLGDRQAAEAVQYDLRWRLALHLRAAGTDLSTPLCWSSFGTGCWKAGQESLAFEAVLDFLVEQGWVPRRSRQRLDSTHVWGLLRVMSRLERSRETLRLWLEDLEAHDLLPPGWDHYWERYVESKLDHRAGVKALEAKLTEAGEDMLADLASKPAPTGQLASRDSFLLLQQVFLENYEIDPAGPLKTHRAQPTGAVQNPHEPEAQWSSKSTTRDKSWVGYKVQVAETVQEEPAPAGEPTANFLTAIGHPGRPRQRQGRSGAGAGASSKRWGWSPSRALRGWRLRLQRGAGAGPDRKDAS